MNINKTRNNDNLTIAIEGRLETTTAPELETVVKTELDGVKELTLDLSGLDYVSSAGLRIILSAQKIMNKQGKMVVTSPNEIVQEIFEVTGFSDILTIE